ncbi:uncharacterized protein LOC133178323 [Saccostrea echinata]|uniref:uncharacterized protein LOC133178323 n=1 Tax=Saccostrea echinata TaxID=191078 RepID=UPI002A83DED5|nr:uncharacterized protein LOC133178323 [Saccostrea echinata]
MFINWIWEILYYFGFYRRAKLMIIGLDNAGKSTLLSLLKHGKLIQHPPTPRPVSEEMTLGGITFTAYDLGGHQMARRLWKEYMPAINAIVFVVDASDKVRISETRAELKGLLESEFPKEVPVAILGNKTDKKDCFGTEELIQVLGLQQYLNTSEECDTSCRQCQIFTTSMLYRQGYGDAFRWLAKQLK